MPFIRPLLTVVLAIGPAMAVAHAPDALARQRLLEGSLTDVAWLGAEHMLTGYDHLLFLLGVLFFLRSRWQVVGVVTAFTVAHTIVLLLATPASIRADPQLIDAVIALTVVYKAFENLGGFARCFNRPGPPLLPTVFAFGLIHGFGLSTRLQEMAIAADPDFHAKIVAFNIGVELGQVVALAVMGAVLFAWHGTVYWARFARIVNIGLLAAGIALFAWQVEGYVSR